MNHYTCPACGQTSYSAAREADMIDPSCPYCTAKAASVCNTEAAKNKNTTNDYSTSLRGMPSGFLCDNCNGHFDNPVQQFEYHDRDGTPEEAWVSPCCHYSYSQAFECEQCGAIAPEEQAAYGLCADCEMKALWRFKWFLLNEFTDRERAYIDACVEGSSLTEPEKLKPSLASF